MSFLGVSSKSKKGSAICSTKTLKKNKNPKPNPHFNKTLESRVLKFLNKKKIKNTQTAAEKTVIKGIKPSVNSA